MKNFFKKITDSAKKATASVTDGVKGVGTKAKRSMDLAKGKVTKLTQFKPKK